MKLTEPSGDPREGRVSPPAEGTLVLFPGALGDAVCLEPALAALADGPPITLYARGAAAEVAALYPSPPRVRSLDAVEIARLFAPPDDPAAAAWLARWARIVSFTGAAVPVVRQRLCATGRAIVAPFPQPPLAAHATDLFLRAVGADPARVRAVPRLVAPAGTTHEAGGAALLALLPGSGGAAKRTPRALHALLAERWRASGGDVAVVLGPAEADEDGAWRTLGRVVRPASIAALAAELAAARAFVGNDAGPSHVAAALGVPGVVLYTATAPDAFGPRGAGVAAVDARGDRELVAEAAWRALAVRLSPPPRR